MNWEQGFLFMLEDIPSRVLDNLSLSMKEFGFETETARKEDGYLTLSRNDCNVIFQQGVSEDGESIIVGSIIPYVSKRWILGKLLSLGRPFAFLFLISGIFWLSMIAVYAVPGLQVLSFPSVMMDSLMLWVPLLTTGFGLLFLVPTAPNYIMPLAYRNELNRIQGEMTNVIRMGCDNLDLAEFKRHNIWSDDRIPQHVLQSVEKTISTIPNERYKELTENLGRS